MATVTGMTAAAMQAIADDSIVDGQVIGDNLHLTTRGGSDIDAGSVRGPAGTNGTNGTNGSTGPTGPAGPTALVGDPIQIATSTAAMAVSGVVNGLVRNNVPMTINHTYGFKVDFMVEFSSVDVDSEWHFWVRRNNVNLEKIALLRPVVTGISFQPVRGEVFWDAPATISTDDFDIYAEEIVNGATITPTGSATAKRKFWIVDYGVVT